MRKLSTAMSFALMAAWANDSNGYIINTLKLRSRPCIKYQTNLSAGKGFRMQIGQLARSETNVNDEDIDIVASTKAKSDFTLKRFELFGDLKQDLKNRVPLWKQDWRDGLTGKTVAATLFLYFACLAPAVAFGGISATLTGGTLGVVEVLLATGCGGMAYSLLCGQPMTFIGPTGLTLVFTTALYQFCELKALPFLPMFSWVGLWTSGFLMLLSATGASNLIRYCTQFTDDIFNSLLAINFIYEAMRKLLGNFARSTVDKTSAFLSLNIAFGYFFLARRITTLRQKRYFNEKARSFLSDLGPVICILLLTLITKLPIMSGISLEMLSVPSGGGLELSGGRGLLVPLLQAPLWARFACAIPSLFLTTLFFLDMNITIRTVNSPRHKLKKPPGYHQDLGTLGVLTFFLSLFGLPWMCAATVQSLAHIRSMAEYVSPSDGTVESSEEIESVKETRLTGFLVHAMIFGSVFLLPLIGTIPMPVIYGVFLFLGRRVMSGNAFLGRIKAVFAEKKLLPKDHEILKAGRFAAFKYTSIQAICLSCLWALKMNKATALYFPSLIGVLMAIRIAILPKLFHEKELAALDSSVGDG